MSIVNNKQYDSRWAYKSYAGQTYAAAGCGPTSVSDHLGLLPTDVGSWMTSAGYASNGSGTYWEGIPAALKHFGVGASQLNYSSLYGNTTSNVFEQFRQAIQNGYCGVLLMGPSMWTTGGHFIAVVGYENGKYRVYDPASASRDGLHAWSDFSGKIKVCYTSTVRWGSAPAPSTWTATGTATCTDNGVNVRSTPGGTVIGQLNAGQRFEVDGQTSGVWTHVNIAGLGIAWVATQYVKLDTPAPAPEPKYEGYEFTPVSIMSGSVGVSVTLFERILKARNIYSGEIDTAYGDGCVEACKKQQSLRDLDQDGICGTLTWHSMIGVPSVGDTYYAQIVMYGSSGASVRLMQELLYSWGYYNSVYAIDGMFGSATERALMAFQKDHGLDADGVCGAKTWKVLIGF